MSSAVLTWNPNTESDLASYKVYRNGVVVATVLKGTQTYTDLALTDGAYTWDLTAVDVKGNESTHSVSVNKVIDTVPPQAPMGLVVTIQ